MGIIKEEAKKKGICMFCGNVLIHEEEIKDVMCDVCHKDWMQFLHPNSNYVG